MAVAESSASSLCHHYFHIGINEVGKDCSIFISHHRANGHRNNEILSSVAPAIAPPAVAAIGRLPATAIAEIKQGMPVSYTHLDVYKRQAPDSARA